MKIVISQLLVNTIRGLGTSFKQNLFGRLCEKEGLVQVAGLAPKLHNIPLEYVGYWRGDAHYDPVSTGDATHKIVMSFQGDSIHATYQGQPADVLVFDPAEYHSRHRSMTISQRLAGRRVLVVALGSIGGKVAKELAKHGVELDLIDMDTIEIQNPYRLNLGLPLEFLIGLDKCFATAEDILLSVPNACIHTYNMDIAAKSKEFDALVADIRPDVIVESVDTIDGTRQVNASARYHEIPLFQIALSDGAETGQIRYVANDTSDTCLLCLDSWAETTDMNNTRRQYAEAESPAQKAVPALSVDTSIVAYIAAKIVMAHLAGEDVRRYFTVTGSEGRCEGDVMWISTTPETWITQDFLQKVVAKVEKKPKCPGCWTPDLEAIRRKKQQRKEQEQS
jgi:molybdopterin/thiamine biosynthesis adenylyltransferase